MSDDKKLLEKIENDDIKEIARLEQLAIEKEEERLEIKKQIKKLKSKKKHKLRFFIRRLDVVSGLHWAKLLFWIGMADAIILIPSDINATAISSITYLMGIIFDMLLLRKQQTKICTDFIRFFEGLLILVYIAFSIVLAIGIAAAALGDMWIDNLSLCIKWLLPICGILSTSMELINNIIEDD